MDMSGFYICTNKMCNKYVETQNCDMSRYTFITSDIIQNKNKSV